MKDYDDLDVYYIMHAKSQINEMNVKTISTGKKFTSYRLKCDILTPYVVNIK